MVHASHPYKAVGNTTVSRTLSFVFLHCPFQMEIIFVNSVVAIASLLLISGVLFPFASIQSALRLECGTSEWFPVTKGVRQGCILSPHLFSLYTEGIMREVSLDHRKDDYEEPSFQGVHLKDLRYADDTALLSTTPTGLENL